MNRFFAKFFGVAIAALLIMEPAVMSAQEASGTPSSQNSVQKPAPPGNDSSEAELPESPGASQTAKPDSTSTAPPTAFQQSETQPTGTAAAPAVQVTGAAVSRPAGSAVAPAKQRRARTFLIRLGLIAGVGVAVGTVAALSLSSPAKVPGSH